MAHVKIQPPHPTVDYFSAHDGYHQRIFLGKFWSQHIPAEKQQENKSVIAALECLVMAVSVHMSRRQGRREG